MIKIGTKDGYWVFRRLFAVLVGATVVAVFLFAFHFGDKSRDNKKYILWSEDVWLLIIGVGDYPYAGYISKFGGEDATSLTYEFSKFVSSTRINLITDEDATKSGIQNAFENWLIPRESADSTVVVYIAGHGTPMYFAPFDSVLYTNENNFSSHELGYWLERLDSQNIVLLMDFCNSYDYSLDINIDDIDIMTCGSMGQICWESEEYQGGIYSLALREAIKKPAETDIDNDNIISTKELFAFMDQYMHVLFESNPPPAPQNPHILD